MDTQTQKIQEILTNAIKCIDNPQQNNGAKQLLNKKLKQEIKKAYDIIEENYVSNDTNLKKNKQKLQNIVNRDIVDIIQAINKIENDIANVLSMTKS